jgi:acetoin utilization protein AcuC
VAFFSPLVCHLLRCVRKVYDFAMTHETVLLVGDALGKYGFGDGHPLGADRQGAFLAAAAAKGLDRRVEIAAPRVATRAEIERFHSADHVKWVEVRSRIGEGFLDYGDTPAFPGCYEIAATVAGTALEGLERIMAGRTLRTFQAIGGLHHARRSRAAGFCVFNDLGVVIDSLRKHHGIARIGYVDIDVHHGDGIYYPYEADPDLIVVDIHEDGNFLFPGTGHASEVGRDQAEGTKLNLPLAPGSGDREFFAAWEKGLAHLRHLKPQFLILQAGADGLAGDPLADLHCTPAIHARVARDLRKLADEMCGGRMMAFGGGGYALRNLAAAWTAVLGELI